MKVGTPEGVLLSAIYEILVFGFFVVKYIFPEIIFLFLEILF